MRFRELRWLLLIALLVIIARVAFFFIMVPYNPEAQDRDHYLRIARNLADNKGFVLVEPVPTSVRPPIAPCFFATILWLFGDHTLSIAFSNWIVDAVTGVLLYLIALEIFSNRKIALVTALLFTFYGPEMYYSWQALSEPLLQMLLAAFVLSFLRAIRSPSIGGFIITGVLLGATSLTRPIMLYYLPVAIAMLIWLLHRQDRSVVKWAAIVSLSFIVTMTPWTVRNYLLLGEFIPGDSHLGITLFHGSYGLDEPDFLRHREGEEADSFRDELLQARLGPAYEDLTQPQRNRLAKEEAIKNILRYPGRYIVRSAVRFFRMWYLIQSSLSWLSYFILPLHVALLVLTAGAFLYYRGHWGRQGVFLITLILFVNTASAIVRANVRYIIPVIPYVLLFAAVTIVNLWLRITQALPTKVAESAIEGR